MNDCQLARFSGHHYRHRGYSLIELMVTLLIGCIILNGVFQIVIASKRSSIDHQEISYIQENARFVLDMISRDVRMAGFLGCAERDIQPTNATHLSLEGFTGTGIVGFDDEAGRQHLPIQYRALVKDKTDALVIHRGQYEHDSVVRRQNPLTHTLELWSPHDFRYGQPLALVDATCRFSTLLTTTGAPSANTISYRAIAPECMAASRDPNSCQACADGHCTQQWHGAAFAPGSRVMPLLTHAYFVGDSALLPGAPALKRQTLTVVNGTPTTRTQELATGIENMQLQYGIDRNNSGHISEYRSAHQMDINNDGVIDHQDWRHVRTVKIELLLVSQSPAYSEPHTVQFAGVNYTGLFMRQVVSTTVTLRNAQSPS